jgi:NADH-quinone oxidoreductase subunit L
MGVVVVFTLLVILAAYSRYVKRSHVPAEESKLKGLHRTLNRKYFVDEIYDFLVVKPLYRISSWMDELIERLGIDALVNSIGSVVVSGSKAARLLQNGGIGFYIFMMVIGMIVLLVINSMI